MWVSAPAEAIFTLGYPDAYVQPDGTSLSAPMVSALASLILAIDPTANVRTILQQTSDQVDADRFPYVNGWNDHLGYGRINAHSALLKQIDDLASVGKSSISNATAGNGQRKLVRETNGKLHLVFESGAKIYYRNTTNDGFTWLTKRISSATGVNANPCITERSGYVYVVWQRQNGSNWDIVYNASSNGGAAWMSTPLVVDGNIACPSPGPKPVILAGTPSNQFEVMVVYRQSNGLRSTRSTGVPSAVLEWSIPITVNGTGSNSMNPSLSYRANSYGYYQLAWDQLDDAQTSQIYHENYYTNTWSSLTWVGSGVTGIASQASPSFAMTSGYDRHIAWQGEKNTRGVIVHRKNLSGVFTVFESQTESYSAPSITGHTSGASLVWQSNTGTIYKATYNGTWVTTMIGSNSSSPSTSVLNPQGGEAKVIWTEGSASPYLLRLGSGVFSKLGGGDLYPTILADSAVEFHRQIVVWDSTNDAYLSIELGSLSLFDILDRSIRISFPAVDDTVNYRPDEVVALLESEEFMLSPDIASLSIDRSVDAENVDALVDQGRIRFELVDAVTGLILGSFGNLELNDPDGSISLDDSVSYLVRNLPSLSVKVRAVVDSLVLSNTSLNASVLNIIVINDVEGTAGKDASPTTTQPVEILLDQNYPNPFNPATVIKYSLPTDSRVRIRIYDMLGREVTTLVDEVVKAGSHEARFEGRGLASGVYFYRLEAGDLISVRKMVLLK